jgi:hypothetical protein
MTYQAKVNVGSGPAAAWLWPAPDLPTAEANLAELVRRHGRHVIAADIWVFGDGPPREVVRLSPPFTRTAAAAPAPAANPGS